MRRLNLDEGEIVRLYVEERLRARAVAKHVGATEAAVYRVLEEAGVKRSARARIPLEEAIRLYRQEGWPASRIAEKFGTTGPTVVRHLRQAGVRTRTQIEARQPAGRRVCPRSRILRAYLLGLVWGDFWVTTHGANGRTVSVSSNTTHREQGDLIREIFEPFGPVYQWGVTSYRASLDSSFLFLSDKYAEVIPTWLRGSEVEVAFAAGYIDAEGSFGVYEGRARFKLDSYDAVVLAWLHQWCRRIGVRSRLRCVAEAGDPRAGQPAYRRQLWRVNVNRGDSLLRFIATLDPYLRHERRRAAAARAQENVIQRLRSRIGDQLEPLPGDFGPH